MGRQEKIATILGIALLYTVIISIFTLLQKINTAIFFQGTINNKIFWFLQRNTLWIIVVAAIIFALILVLAAVYTVIGGVTLAIAGGIYAVAVGATEFTV